ncbi:hypothetical protein TYRP_005794 [Tyrophagus putrescentiae]|nr:hypothetical protein TYRP_005794 [Tyrophagus putrescentiae]
MTSTFSDELTLSQKLSTFCLQFGGQLATAKERLKSGEPLDDVLDQLFLLALGDLCRTLNCSDALLDPAFPNLGDHHPQQQQQQPNQMWTQMLNCFTSSLNEGDDNGDDDGEEDEYEDDEDQQHCSSSSNLSPDDHALHQAGGAGGAGELPKLFHCEYPNCGKSFRRQTDLKSHFQRHNAVKQFECAWPECTFKSTYSSSVGEHIGKLHFKCQTRGPNRADYLDEAKKWIRKINTSADEGDGAGGADKPGTSAAGTSGSPFPTGPFLCCGRNFSNWFNLNKHQNSRKCVSAVLANHSPQKQQNLQKQNLQQILPQQQNQNHQQKFQKDAPVDVSFTAAAAAAVAVYSQQSISGAADNFGGYVEEDADGGQPALKKAKVEEVEVELSSSDDSSDDDSSDSSDSDD